MAARDYQRFSTYGSLAEKIEPVVLPTAPDTAAYDAYRNNENLRLKKAARIKARARAQTVFCMLVVLAVGLVLMKQYIRVTETGYRISEAQKKLTEVKKENALLKETIDRKTDLAAIRDKATNALGMQKPDRSQVVYVSVPKSDVTRTEKTTEKSAQSFVTAIAAFLKNITG